MVENADRGRGSPLAISAWTQGPCWVRLPGSLRDYGITGEARLWACRAPDGGGCPGQGEVPRLCAPHLAAGPGFPLVARGGTHVRPALERDEYLPRMVNAHRCLMNGPHMLCSASAAVVDESPKRGASRRIAEDREPATLLI